MELILPAGSLQAGLAAFRSGADAVYFGLPEFSARSKARNLTIDDVRRLKHAAAACGGRIYAAVNTVVTDAEMPRLVRLADEAVAAGIDACIVQDLGVFHILSERHPELELHASTQMGVHNGSGAEAALRLGISRAVLARELTLAEIAAVKAAAPELELEVFIHGALCFSFSGSCLASGLLLGASANRGACRQVCRTWFSRAVSSSEKQGDAFPEPNAAEGGPLERGYFFSMKDLESDRDQLERLREVGVTALKIEGRMKGPEYVSAAAAYYRELLDGGAPDPEPLRTIFSRAATSGWAGSGVRDERLIDPHYPGHNGVPAGTVLRCDPSRAVIDIRLTRPLALHDGLLLLLPPQQGTSALPEPLRFGVGRMESPDGRRLVQAGVGSIVRLPLKLPAKAAPPPPGTEVRRIAGHDQAAAEISPGSIPRWKYPIPTDILIFRDSITIAGELPGPAGRVVLTLPIRCEPSQGGRSLADAVKKAFEASGESRFRTGILTLSLPPEFAGGGFIPPSELKRIRRMWFARAASSFEQAASGDGNAAGATPFQGIAGLRSASGQDALPARPCRLPARQTMIPMHDAPLPFIIDPDRYRAEDIPLIEGMRCLPLAPVVFDDRRYWQRLERLLQRLRQRFPDDPVLIGLNNIGHLVWAASRPEYRYAADFLLYCANSALLPALESRFGIRAAGYGWVEAAALLAGSSWNEAALSFFGEKTGRQPDEEAPFPEAVMSAPSETAPDGHTDGYAAWVEGLPAGINPVGTEFNPPLFIGRTCFRRHSLGLGCSGCPTSAGPWQLRQPGGSFTVIVRECMTYLFRNT